MEQIQNISNIIFDVKDNLTDGQFKTIMDNLGDVSKRVPTSTSISFDVNTPVMEVFSAFINFQALHKYGRTPLTYDELKRKVDEYIIMYNTDEKFKIVKFTYLNMITMDSAGVRRMFKIDNIVAGVVRFYPDF